MPTSCSATSHQGASCPASGCSTSTPLGRRSSARVSTADGVVAGRRCGDGPGCAQSDCRAGCRLLGSWRSSRSAEPARCTPARSQTSSGSATVIVPARAGVLCAVGLLASPVQHDVVRSIVDGQRTPDRGARPSSVASRQRLDRWERRHRDRDRGRLPLPGPEPRDHRPHCRRLPCRAREAQRLCARRCSCRGRGAASFSPRALTVHIESLPTRTDQCAVEVPPSCPRPTARSGYPTDGEASPGDDGALARCT